MISSARSEKIDKNEKSTRRQLRISVYSELSPNPYPYAMLEKSEPEIFNVSPLSHRKKSLSIVREKKICKKYNWIPLGFKTSKVFLSSMIKLSKHIQENEDKSLMVDILKIYNHPRDIFITCFEKELNDEKSLETVMRGDHPPCIYVLKSILITYKGLFSDIMEDIIEFSQNLKEKDIEFLTTNKYKSKSRYKLLIGFQNNLNNIFMTELYPPFIRNLLKGAHNKVSELYKNEEGKITTYEWVFSSLILLRFLVPLFTVSKVNTNKKVKIKENKEGKRLIARFLMKLSTLSKFDDIPDDSPLNVMLEKNRANYKIFCSDLIKNFITMSRSSLSVCFDIPEDYQKSIENIVSKLKEYENEMNKFVFEESDGKINWYNLKWDLLSNSFSFHVVSRTFCINEKNSFFHFNGEKLVSDPDVVKHHLKKYGVIK